MKPEERRLIIGIGSLFFIVEAGLAIGASGVEALFLSRFGSEALPYMFIAIGVAVPIAVLLTTGAIARLRARTVYRVVTVSLLLVLVLSRLALIPEPRWFYPVLYVLRSIASTFAAVLTWGLAGSICNARQAKRLFPIFAAGGILGGTAGGLMATGVVQFVGAPNLILIWSGLTAVAFLLVWGLTRNLSELPGHRRRERGVVTSMVRGYRQINSSRLMPAFAAMGALFVAAYFVVQFAFSRVAVDRFVDEASLAAFFGLFGAVATALGFVLSLVIAKWLYSRIGFVGALVAYAVVFLAGFVVSVFVPQFAPIVVFRFVQLSVYLGVAGTAYQGVFNVVPRASREQVRLFVDGVLIQAGMLIAGGFLIAVRGTTGLRVPLIVGLALALAATAFALIARARYGRAVMDALKDGVGMLFDEPRSAFAPGVPDQRAVTIAIEALTADDPVERRAAAATMASIDTLEAIDGIVRSLRDPDAEVRKLCLEAIAAQTVTSATLEVEQMLGDSEPAVRRAAIAALGAVAKYPRGLVHALKPLIADADLGVAAAAAGRLLAVGEDTAGRDYVDALLLSDDVRDVAVAIEAYHSAPAAMPVPLIVGFLEHRDPAVRAASVGALSHVDPPPAPEKSLELLVDPDARVSEAARNAAVVSRDKLEPVLLDLLEKHAPADPRMMNAILDVLSEPGTIEDRRRLVGITEQRMSRMKARLSQASALREHLTPSPNLVLDAIAESARSEARFALWAHSLAHATYDHFARVGLDSPDLEERSYSIEAFESMPDARKVRSALALFEAGEPSTRTPGDQSDTGVSALVREVFDVEDAWVRACVLAELGDHLDEGRVRACLSHPSQLVRDAAIRLDQGEETMQTDATVSMVERVILLRKTPVFSRLSPGLLEIVATACEEQSFRKGEVIDVKGEVADCMYVIVEGSVRILADDEEAEIARRGPGEVIGEMSMISHRPRSNTMEAAEFSNTLVLNHRAFEQILRRSPEVSLAVMQVLCERLVEAENR